VGRVVGGVCATVAVGEKETLEVGVLPPPPPPCPPLGDTEGEVVATAVVLALRVMEGEEKRK
jgi:hypothetical protein